MLLFVVLGSSMAVFGGWGVVVFGLVVALALYLYHMKSLSLLSFHVLLVCNLMLVIVVPMTVINNSRSGKPNWSAIAALAVWLLSNRAMLVSAARSRVRERSPIIRTRPSNSAVGAAYACELLLIVATFCLPCACGYLACWALWATVPCVLCGWYAVLHVERSMRSCATLQECSRFWHLSYWPEYC